MFIVKQKQSIAYGVNADFYIHLRFEHIHFKKMDSYLFNVPDSSHDLEETFTA